MLRLVTVCRPAKAFIFYSGHPDVCTAIIIMTKYICLFLVQWALKLTNGNDNFRLVNSNLPYSEDSTKDCNVEMRLLEALLNKRNKKQPVANHFDLSIQCTQNMTSLPVFPFTKQHRKSYNQEKKFMFGICISQSLIFFQPIYFCFMLHGNALPPIVC